MSGLLIGTVRSGGGALISNAVVTVPGVSACMSSGYYRGWIVTTGVYSITATAPGCAARTVTKQLNDSGLNTVDFILI